MTRDMAVLLNSKIEGTRREMGVRNRQPQGTLVTINWNGSDVIDSADGMDVLAVISDRVYVFLESTIFISFRQFWAPATAAISGGGSTPTSGPSVSGLTMTQCPFHAGHAHVSGLEAHDHSVTVPAHGHGLTYGVFKEAMPASHDVNLGIWRLDGSSWTLIVSISGLTDDTEELDVSQWVDGPGVWRFSLQSAAGQPNGGRLGVDLAGQAVGAIKSA